ncbi:MAG: hypothetical protein UV67_C0020G0012 [Parcubacteria group bacterium GW2011_GWC1_43_12]|nr:MAG: hypothetical protein UV34_C0028G0009 [Parcubacteria group bacterium GW2011_GWB1_42_6]KKS91749.1 MAG: hypothetical protein UV67_C0020G0012 [Parcubacteria group bacterium GW2011_GWC1_43_12]
MQDYLKQESQALKKELREKTTGYILAGLGVVAGLAWNEAIKSLIEFLFPLGQNSILLKFLYAILITLFVVILSTYIVRLGNKE